MRSLSLTTKRIIVNNRIKRNSMSGQKKLEKFARLSRVVATPSRVVENQETGEKTQLYTIQPMS